MALKLGRDEQWINIALRITNSRFGNVKISNIGFPTISSNLGSTRTLAKLVQHKTTQI